MIRIFIGYDPREAAAYHVCCQSILEHASNPVQFIPLHAPLLGGLDGQRDGSNGFIYSRYLVPWLCNFEGEAIFIDGDMLLDADILDLWMLRDTKFAAQVVKHEYRTRHERKYIATPLESRNLDYPRKNWTSVMLWNCAHPAHRVLTPEFIEDSGGAFLHRLQWLSDEEIGALPPEWNFLVGEEEQKTALRPRLLHYTLGVPGFWYYRHFTPHSGKWVHSARRAMRLDGEDPAEFLDARKSGVSDG